VTRSGAGWGVEGGGGGVGRGGLLEGRRSDGGRDDLAVEKGVQSPENRWKMIRIWALWTQS